MNSFLPPLDPTSRRIADEVFGNPVLGLREFDLDANRAVFTPMDRAGYLTSSFLGARAVRAGAPDREIPLGALLQLHQRLALPRQPASFLFHIGHCGSTLLSRLLAEIGNVLPLREPPPLQDLSQMQRYFGTARMGLSRDQWRQLFELALTCFTRTWDPAETVLIKPMSHSNNLLPELLAWHSGCRGVLLYVDLPAYLAGMLAPATRFETRIAIRESRSRDFQALVPDGDMNVDALDDAKAAAFVWMMQMREFQAALNMPALRARLLPVHFDDFLLDGKCTLARVATFFGLNPDAKRLGSALDGAIMRSYSKAPEFGFSPEQRAEKLRSTAEQYAGEIERAVLWARSTVVAHPALLLDVDGLEKQARLV